MPESPIVLPSNRPADRFYRGGRRITDLRGGAPAGEHEPEDWIASTTHVFGAPGLGETALPDGRPLRAAVEADPVGWLGEAHVAAFGADAKLLTKLLDAGQRLPVHAHPDGAFAREHLGHAHGKTEAWVILRGGTVHLGLRREAGEEELRALVDGQRTADLLDLLHPIEVAPGDGVLVPAGQLHAIGEGVLLLEVQEPEDLSILLEWDGFAIDGAAEGHLGLGFDTALQAVSRRPLDDPEVAALVTRGVDAGSVLPAAADAFFTVERVPVEGAARLRAGYAVVLVEDGDLEVGGVAAPRGTTLLIPAAAGEVPVTGAGVLLVCRPPRP
ncbi:class I mannose-6-phosphate isomerase [Amnibacterium setariae]|uniref:Carbohydrate kinase n=1 Tax=Amnibacterium setariae TaxID=2306585 RepID=A0A3A1TSG3_9MICO|nr:class I mannose-6-phosphate isomerase [Amnibacterium setariae]RIX26646.1 carbohydrate kinase [Amnibacterium setariae]